MGHNPSLQHRVQPLHAERPDALQRLDFLVSPLCWQDQDKLTEVIIFEAKFSVTRQVGIPSSQRFNPL
jgi:hypothetical protein